MEALATGSWLTRQRVVRIAILMGIASLLSLAWLFGFGHGTLDPMGRPLGTDFVNVWTAGKMALEGNGIESWHPDKFIAAQRALSGGEPAGTYIWIYPPPFLLAAALLAILPYLVALIVWQLTTLAGFTWMMRRLVPKRETVLLTLAAPATLICLTHGQNGFLTALLLGAGLALLDRRPLLAGLLFGCLIYKPQFGIVLPIVLIAGRHWRSVAGAILSAATLVAATIAIWGWAAWQAFFISMAAARQIVIEQGGATWYKLMSPFSAVRLWGGGIELAYAVQACATAAAIAVVVFLALRDNTRLRNAAVAAAVLAATPYVFDYDFIVLGPALAWLWLDGEENGFLPWDRSLMALAWISPLFARQIAHFALVPLGLAAVLVLLFLPVRRSIVRASPFRRSRAAFAP